ncbi:hypothetical protein KP509_1Z094200 [Ceratopteris richardii]|nr:hypothetical protein KP509_1Z094200 [Ceratopteris richardii]KAH6557785.1 hypothetical protein KP509_1Z094200 [Ceratopteris richardii]
MSACKMSTPGSGSKVRRRSLKAGMSDSSPRTPVVSRTPEVSGGSTLPSSVFRVVQVDSRDGDFGATIWMPQSSMLSACLSASDLACVFLYTQDRDVLDISEIKYFPENVVSYNGLTSEARFKAVPGRFCAIASVWPSGKMKEGVKVSKHLAYALGCLQSSEVVIQPFTYSKLDICKGARSGSSQPAEVNVVECNELFLRLCSMDSNVSMVSAWSSFASISSPGTQQLKNTKDMQVEAVVLQKRRKSATLNSSLGRDTSEPAMDSNANLPLASIFGDKNNRASELLEHLAGWILNRRYLLIGNCVCISICGHDYIFEVVNGKGQSEIVAANVNEPGSEAMDGKVPTERYSLTPFYIGNKTSIKFELSMPAVESNTSGAQTNSKPNKSSEEHFDMPPERLQYSALGGLSEQIYVLKEIIEFSLLCPERLLRLGLQPTRGVLLYGPPGTGKTTLAHACANEAGVKFFPLDGPEIVSEYYGESEASLRALFAAASSVAPAVVFIDELDAIAPQRTEGSEHLGQRIVSTLLTIMDGGDKGLQGVLVIAATNRIETIDPALRRPGRFDREIEVGVPSPSGRREILTSLLSRMSHSLVDSDIEALAIATHGFVGADLALLCNEAALAALRNNVEKYTRQTHLTHLKERAQRPNGVENAAQSLISCMNQFGGLILDDTGSATGLQESLKITMDDFEEVKTKVRPSAMREVMLEVPHVRWSDVGGQEDIKQRLQEVVEWPQKHNDAFSRIGTLPPRGVLLYGPPGCSKTLMARAVATEARLNFIAVKGPELFSKWVGESEKAVHSLFQRARLAAPSIVFFDELDGLAVSRDSTSEGVSVGDRVMSQLLVEMDGLGTRKAVTVIAATNRPDKIDPALLRPGRFDRLLYVGPPNEAARLEIFKIHTKNMPCAADVDKLVLASCTNGYTGADISSICREAAMAALEEDLNTEVVSMRHFKIALSTVYRSISDTAESIYAGFGRSIQRG